MYIYIQVVLLEDWYTNFLLLDFFQLGVVQTEGGKVQGKNIRLGFRHHMDIFKGIPYAGVPGKFAKPNPHPGWDGG